MPDWKQLLAQHGPNLVLGLMASATGGPQAHGAYLQGTATRQRDDQVQQQQQERQALAAQMQQAQLANMDADNQRAAQQMELDRLDRLVRRIHELGEQTAATAEDPTTAQQQYLQQVQQAAQLYQVDPSKVSSLATNIGPAVSGKKKKQAAEYIEKLHRMPMFAGYFESPEGLEQLKGLSVPWGESQSTIGEILMMSGLPLETKAKAPGGTINAGSFEEYVNAPPERQAAIRAARKEYMQADDRAATAEREPLMSIMGPDGQPIYVPRSQAVGKRPASTREQGRPVTTGDANRIADLDTSLNDLDTLETEISIPGGTGTAAAIGAKVIPNAITELTGWGMDAKSRQGVIDRVKQVIGKALEGGVLRKEDEYKYERILPTIKDPAPVAASKLQGLRKALIQRRGTFLEALSDAGYDTTKFGESAAPAPGGGEGDPLGLFR